MKTTTILNLVVRALPAVLVAAGLAVAAPAAASQLHTQTFTLQPGWNAVYLEAQPEPQDPESVFQGIPVESVWTWIARNSAIEFVQDPDEVVLRETGWRGYFPRPRPEAFLTNLFAIQVNRPYLILLGGTQAVSWTVTGRPSLQPPRWVPDSFNLVGMGVDPATPPTFGGFFAASPAHTGQPIYRLSPAGAWEQVSGPAATAMRSGEAFWIYTRGASDYQGPMKVELTLGDGLDFGQSVGQLEVALTNLGQSAANFSLELLNAGSGVVDYSSFDPVDGFSFLPLPAPLTVPIAARSQEIVQLVVRRQNVSGLFEGLLEVSDGAGGRRLVPLTALELGTSVARSRDGRSRDGRQRLVKTLGNAWQGLWIGTVSVDQVAEVRVDANTPTATDSTFDARLLFHVDEGGEVRLLKQVIRMWQDGTTTTDPETGLQVLDQPGHYVLVTDPDKISQFRGATIRGDKQVGRRLSTPFLDFDASSGSSWDAATKTLLKSAGDFGTGQTVSFSFVLGAASPTNPFRHRYHNQHDESDESFAVTRTIALTFAGADPDPDGSGNARPDWGETRLAGAYLETLSGLHKSDLKVAGTFTLQRVSTQGALNQ